MTREEAIYWIKNLAVLSTEKDMASITEALNMAIAALKQLSLPKIIIRQGEQEPCDKRTDKRTETHACDCISRQAAIEAICEDGTMFERQGQYSITMVERKQRDTDILDALPSAQPFTPEQIQTMQELESAQVEKAYELGKADRPKGEWKKTEHSTNENGFKKWIEIRCPFCGHEPVYENIDDMEFCPKCGADMRGGDTK